MATDALSQFHQKSQDEKDDFQAENGQIIHYLQNLLTNVSLSRLNFLLKLTHLHQILICRIYILSQLQQF